MTSSYTRHALACALALGLSSAFAAVAPQHVQAPGVEQMIQGNEAELRAHRAARLGAVVARIQAQARETGADRLTDEDIQSEIAAVRHERRSALVVAEPAPPRLARTTAAAGGRRNARRR